MLFRKEKKIGKNILFGGAVTSIGASALFKLGNQPALDASTGLGNMASFFPTMGTIGGTGLVLGSLKQISKYGKKRF